MHLVLVAGPNGAGKTTLFQHAYPEHDRIDADQIARTLQPGASRTDAVRAGRLVVDLLNEGLAAGRKLVFETTFSGRQPIDLARRARERGYLVTVNFVLLESADLHVARVADRVRAGGHEVDAETIRRRYQRSLDNLVENAGAFDEIVVIDNSDGPRTLLTSTRKGLDIRVDTPLTRRLRQRLAPPA